MRFVSRIHISQPPDIVNQAYTDPQNMPYWTKHLEKFEVVKGNITQAGAMARLHFNKKNRPYIMEDELLETEPGKRYKSRVTGQGIIAEVETLFDPTDQGTLLTLKWNGRGRKIPVNLVLYLFRGKIKREAASELLEFKTLVERFGVKFS